jgi:hypothetical protein
MRPSKVRKMRMSEINDLSEAWRETPPPHIGITQLRDVVIVAAGGKPPSAIPGPGHSKPMSINGKATTPEQFAAMFGVKLPETV